MNNLITQKIKEYLQEYLASEKPQTSWTEPLTAFADARDPFFLHLKTAVSPTHALPSDLLPGAGSVVVYFLPFARDIAISNRAGRLASRQWARAYIETNRLIIELNKHLALLLKQEGVKTALMPPTHNFDTERLISDWSHRHAAWIAGLGTFGLHNMLITKSGCCGRLGSFVTTAQLTPSKRPEREYCLYKYNRSCTACVRNCVNNALKVDSFDRRRCYEMLLENAEIHGREGLADVCGKCICTVPCSFTRPELKRVDEDQEKPFDTIKENLT